MVSDHGWPPKMGVKSSNDAAKKAANVSPSNPSDRLTLPASRRIRKPPDFRRVYDEGQKRVGRNMVLWHHPDGPSPGRSEEDGRIGVVASKKTGNAPVRARCKRRLRSLYRLRQHEIERPHEIVLVARRGLDRADWQTLLSEFHQLLSDSDLLSS